MALSCASAGKPDGSTNPLAQTEVEGETGRVTFFAHLFEAGGLVAERRAKLSVAPGRVPALLAGPAPLPGFLSTDLGREECHVSRAERSAARQRESRLSVHSWRYGSGSCRLRSAGGSAKPPRKAELTARVWHGPAASNEQ
jgi:hypothetical protein